MNDQNQTQSESSSQKYAIQTTINEDDDNITERNTMVANFKRSTLSQNDVDYFDANERNSTEYQVQSSQKEKTKRRRTYIVLISVIILLVTILILFVTLTGRNSNTPLPPDPTPDPVSPIVLIVANPYTLDSSTPSKSFNGLQYNIIRNQSSSQTKDNIPISSNNQFYNNVTFRASAMSYNTLRMQFYGSENPPPSPWDPSNWKDQTYLSKNYLNNYYQGLKFQIPITVKNCSFNNETAFGIEVKDQTGKNPLFSTAQQDFIMMTSYLEIGFKVYSRRIFGVGERFTDYVLNEGNYTLYPYYGPYSYDNGKGGYQQYSQHPFVLVQSNTSDFFGIFLYNSNAQTIEIAHVDSGNGTINLIATGGVLDIFIFTGPTYANVMRQYQDIIGVPKLVPYWANGFFTKSLAYSTPGNIEVALTSYTSLKIPLDGWAMPIQSLNDYQNMNFTEDPSQVQNMYSQFSNVLPFTHLVSSPDAMNDLFQAYTMVKVPNINYNPHSQSDQIYLQTLQISINEQYGMCIDAFDPDIVSKFLQGELSSINSATTGIWLDQNTPYAQDIENPAPQDNLALNPFYGLKYVPGAENNGPLDNSTLPDNAVHKVAFNQSDYHYNVHSLFGTQFAIRTQQAIAASQPSTTTAQPFVISDSTFPGAGQYGIAHVLPQNEGSWSDLVFSITNLLNFNMFGIPNVGTNLGGYYVTTDEELYVRYFQLAVVSPIAYFNDDTPTLQYHPFKLKLNYMQSVTALLQGRLAMFGYMRTELYKISKEGGTLLRPVLADFPTDTNLDPNDVTTIMFGCCIKVDFAVQKGQQYKNVYFPTNGEPGAWLKLQGSNMVMEEGTDFTIPTYVPQSSVVMFQKQGTIIGTKFMTDIKKYYVTQIKNLGTVPLVLSIFLDANHQAEGTILIENGSDNGEEYYCIKAQNNMISIKQQNNGSLPYTAGKNIANIVINNMAQPAAQACVLLNDLQTVQTLNMLAYGTDHVTFMPNKVWDQTDNTTLSISDVAFIFYGNIQEGRNDGICNASIFDNYIVQQELTDYSYIAQIGQNIYKMIETDSLAVINLNITLLTDNQLYINFGNDLDSQDYIYDHKYSDMKAVTKHLLLSDILTINENPFYIELHTENNASDVFFTTKNKINFFNSNLNILNFEYPESNPDIFYGWGERKGNFFLEDNTRYSLYSNNNNVSNQIQSKGKLVQYGKSGFFPIVYGQQINSTDTIAVMALTSAGGDYLFFNQTSLGLGPRTTYLSSMPQSFIFTFGLAPLLTVSATVGIAYIGSIYNKTNQIQAILPPPEWMFGSYILFEGSGVSNDQELQDLISYYQEDLKWPLEGFVMSYDNLDEYKSMSYNSSQFQNLNQSLTFIENNNMTIVQILQPGINIISETAAEKSILQESQYIKKANGKDPLIGQDQSGSVLYVDYSNQATQAYASSIVSDYKNSYNLTRTSIQLLKNEITDLYCNGDCITRDYDNQADGLFFKPGNNDMIQNLLVYDSMRSFGTEQEVHNLNGFLQQIAFANAFSLGRGEVPLISSSNALGSGRLGNTAHVMDYNQFTTEDASLAIQNLQSLGLFGMQMIGQQSNMNNIPPGYTEQADSSTLLAHLKLLAFSPVAFSNIKLPSQPQLTHQLLNEHRYLQTSDINYSELVRWRYALMKYTRTQIFYGTLTSDPFITPLFMIYPEDPNTYKETLTQFMYGPSLKVSITPSTSSQLPQYMPAGYWCTPIVYGSTSTNCSYYPEGTYVIDLYSYVYIGAGQILPMQEAGPSIKTSFDLMNVNLDLHILFTNRKSVSGNLFATGFLLIDDISKESPNDYCFMLLQFQGDVLLFADQSSNIGGGSTGVCTISEDNKGFTLGKIYLYEAQMLDFTSAALSNKGQSIATVDLTINTEGNYAYLDLRSLNLAANQVTMMQFQ